MRRATSLIYMAVAVSCATPGGEKAQMPAAVAKSSSPASPLDPPPVSDGDVTVGSARGVRVIIKRIPGAELVSAQLNILGGVRNWGKDDAGIEQLALSVSASGGTESLDKDAFTRRLATLGSTVAAGAQSDFSEFAAKSLRENWDATFELMTDAFLHPALPASEVELQRQRQLSALRHEQEDPDGQLSLLAHQNFFKGHPYENRPIGTLETVSRLKPDQLRDHLGKLRATSRLLLVVVGDLEPQHVIDQTADRLGALPRGEYRQAPLPPVSFDRPNATIVPRKLPTNYILSSFPAPGWPEPDFPAAMVAMTVLNWREWVEVRTKRNLSYAPYAGLSATSAMARGSLYVTAVDPKTTVEVMYGEARKLKVEPVGGPELEGDISFFLTGFLMSNETTDGQAGQLSRAEILGGNWRLARSLPDRMRAVTAGDVQAFARRYIAKLQTVVLGDPEKVDQAIFSAL